MSISASNWSFWTCAPMSTSQSFRYPLTRAKIDASCHGLTSAGKLSPLSGVVMVGETTATVGIANSLVSAAAVCRCRNCGTKPPTNAIRSNAPPDIRIKRISSASPDRVCFMFVRARPDAARISSCAHIWRDVLRLRKRPPQGPLMKHFLSVLPCQCRLVVGAKG